MVQSKLNSEIKYPETKKVFPADENKDLDIYEINILGIPVTICVGSTLTNYRADGIYVLPIYLVKPNDSVVQIGLFEIPVSKFRYYVMQNNEVNIDVMPMPLLYKFSTQEYISSIVNGFEKINEDVNDKVYLARVEKQKKKEEEEQENIMKIQENIIQNKMNFITRVNELSTNKSRKSGNRNRKKF